MHRLRKWPPEAIIAARAGRLDHDFEKKLDVQVRAENFNKSLLRKDDLSFFLSPRSDGAFTLPASASEARAGAGGDTLFGRKADDQLSHLGMSG